MHYSGLKTTYVVGYDMGVARETATHREENKTMTNEKVEALEKLGAKRWTKGSYDRLYIGAKVLGLECSYYKTGNVKDATFRGDSISNCEARRLMYAKTYIDIATGTLYSDNDKLKAAAAELLASVE